MLTYRTRAASVSKLGVTSDAWNPANLLGAKKSQLQ